MENNLEQIRLLNLTEEDFLLLVDGLDALPEKGMAGELMGDLMFSMLAKGDEEAQKKVLAEREMRQKKQEQKKILMKENVKILQGKLLMLKRYLQENKLLKDAYEVLSIPNN